MIASLLMAGLITAAVPSDPEGIMRMHRPDGTDLVVITEDVTEDFDFGRGDTLVVRFIGSEVLDFEEHMKHCYDLGGEAVWTAMFIGGDRLAGDGEWVCENASY